MCLYECACVCVCVCVTMSMYACACSVLALEAVHSVQLVFLVREAGEPHGRFGWTAALAGAGDRVTDAAVGQPAGVAAVVAQQLPGGVHLAHLGDLGPVLKTRPHCLVIGQLGGVDQVVEPTWGRGRRRTLSITGGGSSSGGRAGCNCVVDPRFLQASKSVLEQGTSP